MKGYRREVNHREITFELTDSVNFRIFQLTVLDDPIFGRESQQHQTRSQNRQARGRQTVPGSDHDATRVFNQMNNLTAECGPRTFNSPVVTTTNNNPNDNPAPTSVITTVY